MNRAFKQTSVIAFSLFSFVSVYLSESPKPINWWCLLIFLCIPLFLSVAVLLGHGNAKPHQRCIALGAVGTVLGNQLPQFVSVAMVFTGVAILGLSSIPDGVSTSENRAKVIVVLASILTAVVFLFDNFSVWVVAATYKPGITGTPTPLQDNGQIVASYILKDILELDRRLMSKLRAVLNVQWVVVATVGVCLGVLDLQMVKRRTIYGVCTRGLITLASLRLIRVISFLLTVLPSQNPNCYRSHFPTPPDDWISWIQIGMLPQAHGGCNDLIVSGHATALTTFCCVATSVAGNRLISISLWSMLVIDFLIEVYEGFHYSVDMWMGGLIGTLVWQILSPLESIDNQGASTKKFKSFSSLTTPDIVAYSIPATAAFVTVIILPEEMFTYIVILCLVFIGGYMMRQGFTHYLQHFLICLLFATLNIYL
mmetsp:Transcript_11869/g.18209  ORF Transcript_11869/g.18209 Transcript_11869/m.18209 type:complete len:425 (-) Transcript_11869:285-1559(-)